MYREPADKLPPALLALGVLIMSTMALALVARYLRHRNFSPSEMSPAAAC